MSIVFTSSLTAIKSHVVNYCETVNEGNCKILFLSIKNSGENLNKLNSKGVLASSLPYIISLFSILH